jgi:hypothetical protein
MWKLMNVVFGCHYVLIPWGFREYTVRVKTVAASGEKYVNLFGSWHFLKEDGTTNTGKTYKPLTWKQEDS